MQVQLRALLDSQRKNVAYIESLDERLALEQEARAEATDAVSRLEASLGARHDAEATATTRATEAEAMVATLKRAVRELRVAAGAKNVKRSIASCQTEKMPGPAMEVQTDWAVVAMPLPSLPHGGALFPMSR